MLLRSVEITDFLSIKGSTKLLLDKTITVLLGSNDHGKSNLLKAIEHLNDDRPIKQDEVNWDAAGTASLDFSFKLTEAERQSWSEGIKKMRREVADLDSSAATNERSGGEEATEAAAANKPAVASVQASSKGVEDSIRERELRQFLALVPDDLAPEELLLSRRGVDTALSCLGIEVPELPAEIHDLISEGVPRVELIRTLTGELQDSVSADQLNTDPYEFMQGLFFWLFVKSCG